MHTKVLCVLLFVSPFIQKSSAQNKVRFGLKAGLNFSHFKASVIAPPLQSISDDNYFYAGGQVEVRFNKRFSLQPEMYYVGSSVQEVVTTAGPFERLHLIAIPVLAKLHIGKIALYAGPQLDLLMKAEQNYFDVYAQANKTKNVTDSSYRKAGMSGVAGIEWVFKYRFGVDLRYAFGLSNIASDNGTTILTGVNNQNIKISAIQAGLFFRFGKRPAK